MRDRVCILQQQPPKLVAFAGYSIGAALQSGGDEREIGDVDEGVVEGGEDAGNAEDKLAWRKRGISIVKSFPRRGSCDRAAVAQRRREKLTIANLRSEGDVLLGSAGSLGLGGHLVVLVTLSKRDEVVVCEDWRWTVSRFRW